MTAFIFCSDSGLSTMYVNWWPFFFFGLCLNYFLFVGHYSPCLYCLTFGKCLSQGFPCNWRIDVLAFWWKSYTFIFREHCLWSCGMTLAHSAQSAVWDRQWSWEVPCARGHVKEPLAVGKPLSRQTLIPTFLQNSPTWRFCCIWCETLAKY